MKTSVLCAVMLCAAAAAQAAKPAKEVGPPTADFSNVVREATPAEIEAIRDAMQEKLKDADSAKFRNVWMIGPGEVCGDVNSKNSMGAYAGYSKFNGFIGRNESDQIVRGRRPGALLALILQIDTEDSPIAAVMCGKKLP